MSRNFRRLVATESDGTEDIRLEGPLSNVYFQALNTVYNKDDANPDHINLTLSTNAEGNATDARTATETQAIDVAVATSALRSLLRSRTTYATPPAGTTLYGVSVTDINDSDIVQVAKQSQGKQNFFLVIDYSDPTEENPEKMIDVNDESSLSAVLESMAVRMGVPVYHDLRTALESFSKK